MAKFFYQSHGDKSVKGQTQNIALERARSAALYGFTQVRKFNKGFVKSDNGEASAVIRRLKAGREYKYAIYQYDSTVPYSKAVSSTVSVNGGVPVVTKPTTGDSPTLSGKIKADSSGSITFKFQRKPAADCTVRAVNTQCKDKKPDSQSFDGKDYCCPSSGARFTTLEYPAVTCPTGTVPVANAQACKKTG
jgi:hypothetical protein